MKDQNLFIFVMDRLKTWNSSNKNSLNAKNA